MSNNDGLRDNLLPGKKLESYWCNSQKPSLRSPAIDEKIEAFERSHGVFVPKDFRGYLLRVNGFDQEKNYQDDLGFNFWPLEDITAVSEYEDGKYGFANDDNFFIFCDYLDFSWAYAISFGNLMGQVVKIGTENGQPKIVASNFSDFVDRYLRDDEVLYA